MFVLITKMHMHTSGDLEDNAPKAEVRLQSYFRVAILSPNARAGLRSAVLLCFAFSSDLVISNPLPGLFLLLMVSD